MTQNSEDQGLFTTLWESLRSLGWKKTLQFFQPRVSTMVLTVMLVVLFVLFPENEWSRFYRDSENKPAPVTTTITVNPEPQDGNKPETPGSGAPTTDGGYTSQENDAQASVSPQTPTTNTPATPENRNPQQTQAPNIPSPTPTRSQDNSRDDWRIQPETITTNIQVPTTIINTVTVTPPQAVENGTDGNAVASEPASP